MCPSIIYPVERSRSVMSSSPYHAKGHRKPKVNHQNSYLTLQQEQWQSTNVGRWRAYRQLHIQHTWMADPNCSFLSCRGIFAGHERALLFLWQLHAGKKLTVMTVALVFFDKQRNLEMAALSLRLCHPRASSSAYFATQSPGMERSSQCEKVLCPFSNSTNTMTYKPSSPSSPCHESPIEMYRPAYWPSHGLSKARPLSMISNPADNLQNPTMVNNVVMQEGVIHHVDIRAPYWSAHWGEC